MTSTDRGKSDLRSMRYILPNLSARELHTSDNLRGTTLAHIAARFDTYHVCFSWVLLLWQSPFLYWLFFGQGSFPFCITAYCSVVIFEMDRLPSPFISCFILKTLVALNEVFRLFCFGDLSVMRI